MSGRRAAQDREMKNEKVANLMIFIIAVSCWNTGIYSIKF
jgi:hypothetical protein